MAERIQAELSEAAWAAHSDETSCSASGYFTGRGQGSRMQSRCPDKVLALLGGKPVFAYSVDAFRSTQIFQTVCIVYRDLQQKAALQAYVEAQPSAGIHYLWVAGGERRQDSVFNALKSPELEADYVFIHDCARP